jgi:hypothetical protein
VEAKVVRRPVSGSSGGSYGGAMTISTTVVRRARKPLLVLHIAASVGLMGAVCSGVLIAVAAATARVEGDSAYELMSLQSAVFGIPLSFASLFSGIALGRATRWGTLRYRWTTGKLALQLLVILNGALVLGPTVSARLDGEGSPWFLVLAESASVAMLLLAVVLSVFKPGGRLRRTPPREGPAVAVRVRRSVGQPRARGVDE